MGCVSSRSDEGPAHHKAHSDGRQSAYIADIQETAEEAGMGKKKQRMHHQRKRCPSASIPLPPPSSLTSPTRLSLRLTPHKPSPTRAAPGGVVGQDGDTEEGPGVYCRALRNQHTYSSSPSSAARLVALPRHMLQAGHNTSPAKGSPSPSKPSRLACVSQAESSLATESPTSVLRHAPTSAHCFAISTSVGMTDSPLTVLRRPYIYSPDMCEAGVQARPGPQTAGLSRLVHRRLCLEKDEVATGAARIPAAAAGQAERVQLPCLDPPDYDPKEQQQQDGWEEDEDDGEIPELPELPESLLELGRCMEAKGADEETLLDMEATARAGNADALARFLFCLRQGGGKPMFERGTDMETMARRVCAVSGFDRSGRSKTEACNLVAQAIISDLMRLEVSRLAEQEGAAAAGHLPPHPLDMLWFCLVMGGASLRELPRLRDLAMAISLGRQNEAAMVQLLAGLRADTSSPGALQGELLLPLHKEGRVLVDTVRLVAWTEVGPHFASRAAMLRALAQTVTLGLG